MRAALVGVALLAGCGGFSPKESRALFSALGAVVTDVAGQVDDAVLAGEGDGLTVSGAQDAWQIDGTLTGGEHWAGAVDLAGDVSGEGRDAALDLGFEAVEVPADRVELDAALALAVARDLPTDDAPTSWAVSYAVSGDVSSRGRARGSGPVDYVLDVVVEGDAVTLSASGTIDGHDVSEFSDIWSGSVAE